MSFDEDQGTNVSSNTKNATTFHFQDAPNTQRKGSSPETKQEQMKRLFTEYQTGLRNGKWAEKDKLREQDNAAIFDAISSQLELPQPVRDRGHRFLKRESLRDFGHPTRLVIFCLCAQLYNIKARDEYRYHPNRSDANNPDRYLRVADNLDLRTNQILSVYNKVGSDIQ
jgi:hypothetical protein